MSIQKAANITFANNQNTYKQGKPYNKKTWINRSPAIIVSLDSTTAFARRSRNRSKSLPLLYVHAPDGQTLVAGSAPIFSSSMPLSCTSFCKAFYGPGHLIPKCLLRAQDFLLQLPIIRNKKMRKLTGQRTPSNMHGVRYDRFGRLYGRRRGVSSLQGHNTKVWQTQEHSALNQNN